MAVHERMYIGPAAAGRVPLGLLAALAAGAASMVAAPLFSTVPDAPETSVVGPEPPQPYLGRLLDEGTNPSGTAESVSEPAAVARFRGRLNDGLASALAGGGVPPDVADGFMRTIADRARGVDIGPDDHFDLVVDWGSGKAMLVYAALDRVGASDVQLLRVEGTWVDAGEVGGKTARPVDGRLTSRFGTRRHPLLGFTRMHQGVDFAAAHGAPVVAASSGQVVGAGWAGGYGRQVRIAHGGGLSSSYSHLSRFAVAAGRSVRAGEVIGYAGSSGLSTGPHVHYEVRRNGRAIDPLGSELQAGMRLDRRTRDQMLQRIAALLTLPPQPRS